MAKGDPDFGGLLRPSELRLLLEAVAEAGLRVPRDIAIESIPMSNAVGLVSFHASSVALEGHEFTFWMERTYVGPNIYLGESFPSAGTLDRSKAFRTFGDVCNAFQVWCHLVAEDLPNAKPFSELISEVFSAQETDWNAAPLSDPPTAQQRATVEIQLADLEKRLRKTIDANDERLDQALAEIAELKKNLPKKPSGWSAGRCAGIAIYFMASLILDKEVIDPLYDAARTLATNLPLLPGK